MTKQDDFRLALATGNTQHPISWIVSRGFSCFFPGTRDLGIFRPA